MSREDEGPLFDVCPGGDYNYTCGIIYTAPDFGCMLFEQKG